MGADTRFAYIRYTRARVRRLAVVAAVGRGRGGLAAAAVRAHMILLYQVIQGTRNIARLFRMSSRAKSQKIG